MLTASAAVSLGIEPNALVTMTEYPPMSVNCALVIVSEGPVAFVNNVSSL